MPTTAAEKPTKTEGGNAYPAEAYAFVPDAAKPSTWKIRLWQSPEEKETAAITADAAEALGSKGFRGNKAAIPDDARAGVVAKVRAAWKRTHPDAKDADMPEALKADEPTASDVHVDGLTSGASSGPAVQGSKPKKGRSAAYLEKFLGELKDKVAPEVLDAAHLKARAHAGGKGRAAAMAAALAAAKAGDGTAAANTAHDPVMDWGASADWPTTADAYDPDDDDDDDCDEQWLEKSDPAVQYRDADKTGEACGLCRFYGGEGPSTCSLVEGLIRPEGVCNLFHAGGMMAREVADLCAFAFAGEDAEPKVKGGWLLFNELRSYVEPPEWLPYLPKPGEYSHPQYGKVKITPERNARFAQNFTSGVYQSRIPIDLEHQTKLSGAAGWIVGMRQNADGSVDARTEWTDRGTTMLRSNRFAYFSPEWYDSWTAPESDRTYSDVPIGGALTTRPFFKERSLRSLIASERGVFVGDAPSGSEPVALFFTQMTPIPATAATAAPPAATTTPTRTGGKGADPMTMSEADARRFAELERKAAEHDALQARLTATEAELTTTKTMAEHSATALKELAASSRRQRFTEEVMGKGEANPTRWYGEPDRHIKAMEMIADTFGEHSEQFDLYVQQGRAAAEAVRSSELFTQRGRPGTGPVGSASERLAAMATAKAAELHIPFADAMGLVASENPDLYARHGAAVAAPAGNIK